MFSTPAEMLAYINANDIPLVDLLYVDLLGQPRHVTVARSYFTERIFTEGVGLDGSSLPGFKSLESGDVSAIPDPTTAFMDPFTELPTLTVLCGLTEADTKEPLAACPRNIARKAEEWLRASRIADTSLWGPEFEYYLFDEASYLNEPMNYGVSLESVEHGQNSSPSIRHQKGYHAAQPQDRTHDVRSETLRLLEEVGIAAVYHHHEVGAPGQVEFEIGMTGLVEAADNVVKGKYIAKMVAKRYGMVATFMPKPMFGAAGSGMHFHQHLFKHGKPLFFEEGRYADLSALGCAYTAGLLEHGEALLALTNPSTNSYRRLVPGFEAPIKAFFSLGNRSAAIRVPRYATSPESKRIEFRPPDATCNPYLSMAAMLLAGLDGIQRELDPTPLGYGPIDANAEKLPQAERDAIKSLPSRLSDALEALANDHDFLVQGGVFSESMVHTWIGLLNQHINQVARRPHPFEFELYSDV